MSKYPVTIQLLPTQDAKTVVVLISSTNPIAPQELFTILKGYAENASQDHERDKLKAKLGIS